jgi:hypothetical protein
MSKCISKHVVEVRFKPNAAILDKRGQIAESLTVKQFDFWSISDNRIDFVNKDCKHISGFLSFRNAGFSSVYPMTVEYFVENAKDFIQRAWIFFGTNEVIRIGVRSTFLSEVSDFENTLRAYREHFLKLNDEEVKEFGGQLVDVGFPLNFVMGGKRFNIMTGPMKKAQALIQYGNEEGIPETAIFLDVDYFKSEFGKEFRLKEALNFIEEGTQKAREINKLICNWICGPV